LGSVIVGHFRLHVLDLLLLLFVRMLVVSVVTLWGWTISTTASAIATTGSTTAAAKATALVAALEVTIGILVLMKVSLLGRIVTITRIGTKVTTHAIRECIWIVTLRAIPHSAVLAIPACSIHPLAGIEIHAHIHSIHAVQTVHTSHAYVWASKASEHSLHHRCCHCHVGHA
jgi:hypothetical protein